MHRHLTLPLICTIALMSSPGVDSMRAQDTEAPNPRAQAVLDGFIQKAKAGGSTGDAFLKLDDVKGSATDSAFKDQIAVLFTRNSVSTASGTAQPSLYYLAIPLDKSYPILEQAAASSKPFVTARISFRHSVGGQQVVYSEDVLSNVRVVYFLRTSTPAPAYPEIAIIGLSCATADWSYGTTRAGRDFSANKNR